ncbi:hypothetical protein X777_15036 [Ooceraea biroi]|uniref:Uncharacterized protein n=1 Tax=Ooceraea biroi TaxID=2015173 RepID=A0A026VW13_OOCBI|nr:hypothetical protein X777_15036 [Ooceraea biroi]
MSSDPNDLIPLTPAHFLIGRTLTSPADPTLTDLLESRLSRWQLIQTLQQHFWRGGARSIYRSCSNVLLRKNWNSPL